METPHPRKGVYPKWLRFKARDGEALDLAYVPPSKLGPSGRAPLWISTYSGPAAPSRRDVWRGPSRTT